MKTDWKKVKLGELCEYVTSGGTPLASREDYYNPPLIPWLKTKEVNYTRITKTENFISQKGLDNSSAKLIPENSVIIAMYGQGDTAGRVSINKIPLATNQACCNFIIDKQKADYNYIYYQLCTMYDKMVSLKSGGAQPNLNAGKLKELEISLPPLETQQKIASILSAYDDLIENNRKQIKLLEEAAQRLYKEWFVDLRFPGYENVAIVDGVPEGWRKEKIGDWCKVFTGKKNANQNIEKGLYPFFTCAPEPLLSNDSLYTGKAVIISGNGSYTGRTQFYDGSFDLYQRTYACVKLKDIGYEYLPFIYYTMKILFEPIKMGGTKGAAIPYIVMADITDTLFLYNDSICKQYSFISENILDKIGKLKRQIQLLQQARDKLLPRLMSGEMEV